MAESFNVSNNTDKSTIKSCKSATFESGNLSFDEEIEFKMFLIYTYIYALMKLPRFIPDHSLRAKLFWDKDHQNKYENNSDNVWCWIYGLDKESITEFVKGKWTREDIEFIHIEKYFEKDDSNNKLIVKEEFKSLIKDKIKNCPALLEGKEELAKRMEMRNNIVIFNDLYSWQYNKNLFWFKFWMIKE